MRFALRKTLFYLFTAWAAITINFLIPRMMKGDPVSAYLAKNQGKISPEAASALRTLFGLDTEKSLWEQYIDYWQLLFSGDLGRSFSHGLAPVTDVIGTALPWTVGLVGIATIVSFILGTAVGAVIGWRRGRGSDAVIPVATFFSTVPYFWMGLIAIAVFSSALGWFPASHAYGKGTRPGLNPEFMGEVLYHGALPAITIVIASLGGWILGMRNMMVTVLDEDYITVAQAKGLSDRRVVTTYAARNAMLPQLSSFALALGFIVGGTLVMELVFSYPGIGKLLLDATNAKDYPLMQGVFLVITLAVLVTNILADIAYVILDPRARQEA
ncbi:peptide ABC transporter permease [Microbacterium sp. B35-04]|uniref:ABC transporter permease n=1 Tax=unclassified Microbacterium TaxID=2609290 RepID=UPI0013D0D6E7|nr:MULTISPECIES: ABC transporter permease [unclassified Microbacterium]KAF2413155.1 peptide ABC transporter permease [Microbacterium sp. B35-04]KAF2416478.1 peptide ABC transporter permease [Microbacterium sp. B35-30]